jgi:hypothetical protein
VVGLGLQERLGREVDMAHRKRRRDGQYKHPKVFEGVQKLSHLLNLCSV